MTKTEYLKYGI